MNRAALRVFLALAVLSLAPAALASDPFPETIKTQLNLPEAPLCTVCHQTLIGGLRTVTKPFGQTLQQKYGLILGDVQGLRAALMQMQANGDDSDGDGVSDVAELLQGTDPNVAEGGTAVDEPRYGCQCSSVRAPGRVSAGAAAWVLGIALSGWRRRRKSCVRRERET
jgi:MYXO-CTERM domain-containing protein